MPRHTRPRPLRHLAAGSAGPGSRPSAHERLAALTLATDADEKLLIECVGLHPLLDAAQLAVLLDLPAAAVERRIERLRSRGAVEELTCPEDDGGGAAAGLVLSGLGLRWLAARDGVSPRLYAQYGAAAATGARGIAGTSLEGLIRHLDHSLGVNRTLVRLASDVRRAGHRLAEWRNEAESTRRFRDGYAGYWIRPDAAGSLQCSDGRYGFLLEYDRGTMHATDYRAKLAGYHRYYDSRQFEDDFDEPPVVLVVAQDDRAEEHVARAARLAARMFGSRLPLILTAEWWPPATSCAFCGSSTRRTFLLKRWRVLEERRDAQSERVVNHPMCAEHEKIIRGRRLLLGGRFAFGGTLAESTA